MSDQAGRGDRMPWLWSFGPAARDDAVGSTMRNGWVTAGAAMIVMWWVPAACGQVASSAGAVWCDRPLGHVIRVADAPVLDGDDPLAEAVWQQVQPIGRLFSKGQPEPADRATDVRMLVHGAVLYVAARCLDPQADGIARGGHDGRRVLPLPARWDVQALVRAAEDERLPVPGQAASPGEIEDVQDLGN